MNQPPVLGPNATKYQIDQVVFKDNKYRRYEIEVVDDEEKTAEQPIKVILLKSMEGKTEIEIEAQKLLSPLLK